MAGKLESKAKGGCPRTNILLFLGRVKAGGAKRVKVKIYRRTAFILAPRDTVRLCIANRPT